MPGHGAFSDGGAMDDGAHERAEGMRNVGQAIERAPLPGNTARDLAGPLALKAMRSVDAGLNILLDGTLDRDERVRLTAARWLVQAAPKVAMLAPPDAAPAVSDADRDAALRAALESAEFCALLVTVVAHPEGAARLALIEAGWTAPE